MKKIRTFLKEVVVELEHATWPWDPAKKGFQKYRELIDSTIVVFIATILLGAFVALNDLAMAGINEMITKFF